MSGLLDPRQWLLIAALCAASVLGVNFWSARLVDRGDSAGYARARAETVAATLVASEAARDRERKLQTANDLANKEINNEITRLRREHAAAIERLLNRPQRPVSTRDVSPLASNGPPASGCTGAQLYREDGLFSRGEAARAETIRLALMACYGSYERADDARLYGSEPAADGRK